MPARMRDMKEESDGTLLYYISCRGNAADEALSNAAAKEFHHRHMKALYERCRRICQGAGASADFAQDLAQAAFVKAAQRADAFTDGSDPSLQAKRTQAWLGKVAHNLLVDSLRNPKRPGPITGVQDEIPSEDYSDDELASLLCDGNQLPRSTETIHFVRAALPTLDERTRIVLIHTVLQRQHSPKGTYMYRGSAAALANRIGTTAENIRRIRRKGLAALATYVRRHSGKP